METYGACGGNWMLPSGYLSQDHVIAVNTHEPIDATDETYQEEIERRDAALFGKVGMEFDRDERGNYSGYAEEITNPDHREPG